MSALVKVCSSDTSTESYIQLLASNVSLSNNFIDTNTKDFVFSSISVDENWFDNHKILADIKNLKYSVVNTNGQKLLGGAWSWSVKNGHPVLTYFADCDNWYSSDGQQNYRNGGNVICDFYAVKMQKEV